MTQILLIRHGQASFGSGNYDVLSPIGERQAALVGAHLQRIGWQQSTIVAGSLRRQQHTAALAGYAEVITDPAFNEYPFEGILKAYLPQVAREQPELELEKGNLFADRKRFQAMFQAAVTHWFADTPTATADPLESWQGFKRRGLEGVHPPPNPGAERLKVFPSRGVIAVAMQAALGSNDTEAFNLNWRVANASLHRFKRSSKGLKLDGYNDISHLQLLQEAALVTYR